MLKERTSLFATLVFSGDMLALMVAFYAAYFLRSFFLLRSAPPLGFVRHFDILVLALPAFALCFAGMGLYQSFSMRSLSEELRRTAKASGCALLVVIVLIFYLKYQFASRSFLGMFSVFSCALAMGQRMVAHVLLGKLQLAEHHYCNILIVGTGDRARQMGSTVSAHGTWGLRLMGYIQEDDQQKVGCDLPICGTLGNFQQTMHGRVVDGVVFAVPHERVSLVKEAFDYCRQVGIPVYFYVSPYDEFVSQAKIEELGGIGLIAFPNKSINEYQVLLKRAFDLAVSAALLAAFAPLIPLIAVSIKLNSPGSVFFRQTRVGMNGRLFTLYKFRTMVVGAEAMKSSLAGMNEMDGPVFKIRKDPRVSTVGRFLRRISLDEVPQLFNVLAGHMSVVGPRPPLPEEVSQYEVWHRRRLSVRPGLTCLWQVSGRNGVDFRTWMELDLQYIDNWSWKLDLSILFRTIPAMFRGN